MARKTKWAEKGHIHDPHPASSGGLNFVVNGFSSRQKKSIGKKMRLKFRWFIIMFPTRNYIVMYVYIYMYINESLACWECEDLVTKFSGIPRVYIVCITLTTNGTNSSANSTHMSLLEVAPHSLSTTIALYF
jgi:hypothetical protein